MKPGIPAGNSTINLRVTTSGVGKRVTTSGLALLVLALLAGCHGSLMQAGFSPLSVAEVSRKALTERMFGACKRETTPLFNRPSSPYVGKCKCAAVSFLNYATEDQVDDLRSVWAVHGTGKSFVHKVLSLTDQFHNTHCGVDRDAKDALALTALRSKRLADARSASAESESVQITTEPNPQARMTDVPLSDAGVLRFQLSPSAVADADLVRYVQRKLKGLGYEPGAADGVMGPKTRAALNAYRDAKSMPADTPVETVMSALLF